MLERLGWVNKIERRLAQTLAHADTEYTFSNDIHLGETPGFVYCGDQIIGSLHKFTVALLALTQCLVCPNTFSEIVHRYIMQERMKIPGAWWKIENADDMLAVRSMRANKNWDDFWQSHAETA